MKHNQATRRQQQLLKFLHRSDNLKVKEHWIRERSRRVKIKADKACAVCQKKIGTRYSLSLSCVCVNAILFSYSCSSKQQVCLPAIQTEWLCTLCVAKIRTWIQLAMSDSHSEIRWTWITCDHDVNVCVCVCACSSCSFHHTHIHTHTPHPPTIHIACCTTPRCSHLLALFLSSATASFCCCSSSCELFNRVC